MIITPLKKAQVIDITLMLKKMLGIEKKALLAKTSITQTSQLLILMKTQMNLQ